jgi:hypothetical protein
MSVVTRYFSTAAAGAGDGTSWADRAALFSGGVWSTVITQFAGFAGSDSLLCYIGPGAYTITNEFTTTDFTGVGGTAPSAANPLFLHGCDSSGNPLTPPDPNWTSDMPPWDDSSLPVLATTTNIAVFSGLVIFLRLLKCTATARNGSVVSAGSGCDWCVITNSTSNTSSVGTTISRATNSVLSCTGTSYNVVLDIGSTYVDNCRVIGSAGASGNRNGIVFSATTAHASISRCTVVGVGGVGILNASSNAANIQSYFRNTVVGCGSDGIRFPAVASQTGASACRQNYVSGCGGYGINVQSANVFAPGNRLRDNTSGNLNGLGNYPDLGNYTTDSDDATEFVNSAIGDYRIKSGSAIHGMGFGVSDQASSSVIVIDED